VLFYTGVKLGLSHYGNPWCGHMRENRVLWRKFGSKRDVVNR